MPLSWEDTYLRTPGATRHAVKCFRGANFNNVTRDTTKAAPLPVPKRFDTDVYSFLPFRSTLFLPVHVSANIPLYTCLSSSIITIGTTNTTKQPPIIYSVFFRFFGFSLPPEYVSPSCLRCIYNAYLSIIFRLAAEVDSTNGNSDSFYIRHIHTYMYIRFRCYTYNVRTIDYASHCPIYLVVSLVGNGAWYINLEIYNS